MHKKIIKEIISSRNKNKGILLTRFFKTGPGQYGEGDLFLGITVPESRKIAIKHSNILLSDISQLIINKYHEVRLIALLVLVNQYQKTHNETERNKIYNFYLKNTKYINNWDLVDLSAHYLVGNYLINKDRKILEKLAK